MDEVLSTGDVVTLNAPGEPTGRELLAKSPDLIDVPIVLATIGFDNAALKTPNDRYNNDAINYARQAIQQMEAGKTSKQYGAYAYSYNNKDNAMGWMNYTIGYIMFNRMNQKKEALPYLYKATQHNGGAKNLPIIYQMIGDFYKEEYNRIDDQRTTIAKEAEADTNEETKKQKIDKAKELLALQKGYADRMIDAYARARANAAADKAYQDALYNTLKILYGVRFDGKTDGLDAYLSSTVSKPMPDPTSTVTPVAETSTTATTSSTTTTTPATNGAGNGTKATNGAKTTNGTTAGTTNKTTTPAKKPVAAKKKGTR
mgnify:CR=1 FL=1